ncbi:hypothetical protein [Paenirhodobacter enshiensis]|uniref:hypothetical protein n=1 Tax=Paenirhodobacter enshiensis TaxID=1105367 RepID=UPI001267B3B3|nr:hypothetical protein [Paenirhodobacter enshiensis]
MKYDLKLEREFLRWVEDECFDPDGPGYGARYDEPNAHSLLPGLKRIAKNDADQANRVFVAMKNIALDRGWVHEDALTDDTGRLRLSQGGYARLDWHVEQSWWTRLRKFTRSAVGTVIVNLMLPAVVAYVTVQLTNAYSTK